MARQSLLACSILALTLLAGAPSVVLAQTPSASAAVAADPAAQEVAEAIRDGFRQYLSDPARRQPAGVSSRIQASRAASSVIFPSNRCCGWCVSLLPRARPR